MALKPGPKGLLNQQENQIDEQETTKHARKHTVFETNQKRKKSKIKKKSLSLHLKSK